MVHLAEASHTSMVLTHDASTPREAANAEHINRLLTRLNDVTATKGAQRGIGSVSFR